MKDKRAIRFANLARLIMMFFIFVLLSLSFAFPVVRSGDTSSHFLPLEGEWRMRFSRRIMFMFIIITITGYSTAMSLDISLVISFGLR